jgi:hypothetical protein
MFIIEGDPTLPNSAFYGGVFLGEKIANTEKGLFQILNGVMGGE